jgi:hypothetical protein
LNACPNLPLQVATQAVLLHQVPALPDGAHQVTVTQPAQILGRAQILARLAVHVAGIGWRLLRLLRLLLLLAGLFRSPVGKFPPDLPDAPRRHGPGQIGLTTLQPLQPLLQLLDAHLLEALSRILRK